MPSTYTSSLRLEKQASFENNDSWGTRLNAVIDLVEAAIAGVASIDCSAGGNITLSTANGSADQARCAQLYLTGSPSANFNVVVPNVAKMYMVSNGSTKTATIKTASGTTTYAVAAGTRMIVFCDGANSCGAAILGSSATSGSAVSYTPGSGTSALSATNVQDAIFELALEKADKSGAVLTNCTANTPPADQASSSIATTAHVHSAITLRMGSGGGSTSGAFPAGTRLVFDMDNPPAGWVRDNNPYLNDRAIRFTGDAARADINGIGGFSGVFGYRAVEGTQLNVAHMPWHQHTGSTLGAGAHGHNIRFTTVLTGGAFAVNILGGAGESGDVIVPVGDHAHLFTTDPAGGSQAHSHIMDMRVHTRTVIIGQRV